MPLKASKKNDKTSSQEQIALNKRSPRKRISNKQVQLPEAGLKRYKTQTKDEENPYEDGTKAVNKLDAESSSFAEDKSQ